MAETENRHNIVVRVMVGADSVDTAQPLAAIIEERIRPFGLITRRQIERYWKIPEWFEIDFVLHLPSASNETFDSVLAAIADGWDRHVLGEGEAWAVWTPQTGSFCFPDARWANVEYYPDSASRQV